MREPTVYINGEPVCARPPNKIGEYAELGNVTSKQLEEDEAEFVRVCEGQMKANDNKKRAKYRFASKTLMRILPVSLKSEVEGLIEKKAITLDLYEILGQCTWGQKAAEKA